MKEQEIYYYSDELNDEFSGSHITPRVIDEKYKDKYVNFIDVNYDHRVTK